MKTLFGAAALAVALVAGAGTANAATTLDQIDSTTLNQFGTEDFGALITDDLGNFTHVFEFTLDDENLANATLGSILLGAKDIDFSSIDLDGVAFTQVGFDPSTETWELANTLFSAGAHVLTVRGSVIGFGDRPGATYTGSLNLDLNGGGGGNEVPEPATWAMMIMGFGGVGAMMRRRRQALALA